MTENTPISAIRIFSFFEKAIASIDTYPLQKDNLIIQQDAYKRLAGLDPENVGDEEGWEVFAIIENSRKEMDREFRFYVEFALCGFSVSIEGVDQYVFRYDDVFNSNKEAAEQLIFLLICLSNGQLRFLTTLYRGRFCAQEWLFYESRAAYPEVLSTEAKYRKWWKKEGEPYYDTFLLNNKYDIKNQPMPKKFFLCSYGPDGAKQPSGRTFTSKELVPLTKVLYDKMMLEVGLHITGLKSEEDMGRQLFRMWEFWSIIVVFVTPAVLLVDDDWFFVLPFVGIAGLFAASTVCGRLVYIKRQALLGENEKKSLYIRFDNFAKRWGTAILYLFFLFSALMTAVFPIFVDKTTGDVVSLLNLVASISYLLFMPVLGLFVAMALRLLPNFAAKMLSYAAAICSVIAIVIINEVATNTNIPTPEPYTSIALMSYLLVVVLAITGLVLGFRKHK